MSFFDNVQNLDEIPDDPFSLPDGTYKVRVIEANHGPTKNDENKFGLLLKYQIIAGPHESFFPFTEWLHTPGPNDDVNDPQILRAYASLKKHFLALGFGADELHKASAETVVDREAYVKTKTVPQKDNPDRKQIRILDITPVGSGDGMNEFANDVNSVSDF